MAKRPSQPVVTESSGNVFADIGVVDPEQALLKAELARRIAGIIETRGLSQAQAARCVGTDQGKISALVCGRLAGFSTDRLFRWLNALGQDVVISIEKKPRSRDQGRVRVQHPAKRAAAPSGPKRTRRKARRR